MTLAMPSKFQCRCGKWLRARAELADKQVRCPGCGRLLLVPAPAPTAAAGEGWQVDAGPAAADAAQHAGVVHRGRASVVRLHAGAEFHRDLHVSGEVTCRFCRTSSHFRGDVFGRAGLGGTLANVGCPVCKSRIWIAYASHAGDDGTDIFIYAPSLTRDFTIDEGGGALPAPALSIRQPPWLYPAEAPVNSRADTLLTELKQALTEKQSYDDIRARAAALVLARLAPSQLDSIRGSLRRLLAKQKRSRLMAILTEALVCLRDKEAGPIVQATLRHTLNAEDLADRSNAPLRELCVLSLLFSDASGFKEALERGLPGSAEPTRACKLGKQLTLTEIIDLVTADEHIDSYESVFRGDEKLFVYRIRPENVSDLDTERQPGFLSRLFGSRKKTGRG
jgi:hypothetical protein